MMNNRDKQKTIQRYEQRWQRYGHDIRTLGWGGDRQRQQLRFTVHLESQLLIPEKIESVLDIGCGFGDMGSYLRKAMPSVRYTGVDISPTLIEAGRARQPELDLRVADILEIDLPQYDLVCESGVFNFQLKHEDQAGYIQTMLKRMFALCRRVVSADFMSTFVDFRHEGAFHFDETDCIRMAKALSKRIILRNDYLDYEYCLYIFKHAPVEDHP